MTLNYMVFYKYNLLAIFYINSNNKFTELHIEVILQWYILLGFLIFTLRIKFGVKFILLTSFP